MRRLFSTVFLVGCNGFSASTDIPDTNEIDSDVEVAHDSDEIADSETPDPADVDDDDDGFSENQGDCDDADDDLHPNATDNCNGETDEDARMDDPYELTNGDAYPLSALTEAPEQSVQAALYNDNDQDAYDFYLDDPFYDAFTLYIELDGSPNGAEYELTLAVIEPEEGDAGVIDTVSGSESLEIVYDDSWNGTSQAGLYRVTVSSAMGADCSDPYSLSIEKTWL